MSDESNSSATTPEPAGRGRGSAGRDAARAKDALLDAALRLFSQKGYKGARTADIARAAGYSEALVYFHFGNKAGLFKEVVSRVDEQTRWWSEDDGTPQAFVDSMRDGELRYHLDSRWRALDHVWGEALGGDRELLDMIRPQLRHAVDALEGQLAQIEPVAQGAPTDRRQLALLLLAVSYGTRVLRRYDPDAVSPEEAADLMRFAAQAAVDALRERSQEADPA